MIYKLIIFIIALTLSTVSEASPMSKKKLPDCSKSPNCVSSQAQLIDKQHFIAPFEIRSNPDEAWTELKKAIIHKSRMVITHETHDTLHAEATSLLFRFVDDIDAILDAEAELIHIRSASRTGHHDFGINRKRIEALRLQLKKANVID